MKWHFGIETEVEPKNSGERAIGIDFVFWRFEIFIGWHRV